MKRFLAVLLSVCLALGASAAVFAENAEKTDGDKTDAAGKIERNEDAAKMFMKLVTGSDESESELLDGVVDGSDTRRMLASVAELVKLFSDSELYEENVLELFKMIEYLDEAAAEKIAAADEDEIFDQEELQSILEYLTLAEGYENGTFDEEDFFALILLLGSAVPWWEGGEEWTFDYARAADKEMLKILHDMDKKAPKDEEIVRLFELAGLASAYEQSKSDAE